MAKPKKKIPKPPEQEGETNFDDIMSKLLKVKPKKGNKSTSTK